MYLALHDDETLRIALNYFEIQSSVRIFLMNGKLGLGLISFLTGFVSLALSYFGLPAMLFGPICAVLGCFVFSRFF